ncbi:MAG: hypothetical protein JWN21_452 [Sphingomonas bacterium]|uniref:helix-turn-helix domain-containing protein n=1 Tax=Sphingomonas bacterium TaxID=1895847 RepID=UPI00260F06F7|nr:helix-turn-helix domain-containing protein [Sphingomonas bacterium]MDB5694909.1 hypothetical protein [Sphingomonas bacterium]
MTEGFLFASADRDPDEAFADYARLYANGARVERADGPFAATVAGWRLDGMILFDRRFTGVTHFRDPGKVRTDGFDHLVVHAVLAGTLHGSDASRFKRVEPGEVVLLDTREPSRQTPVDAHLITVSIARYRMTPAIDGVSDLHGRVLRPPATLILVDFLRSLVRHAGDTAETRSLSHAFVELLGGALEGSETRRTERGREEVLRREAIGGFVQANLSRRKLGADVIGDALGISRSALYRLMEPQGGVTQFIQKRRLQAVRDALEQGSEAAFADLAEQHGFADEARMRRLFAAAFGVTPTAYRADVRAHRDDGTRVAYRRWEGWMGDLS